MINRDDIEAGDRVYTRDGGCLVARQVGETTMLGDCGIAKWVHGKFLAHDIDHPLDIIRIEKAPKPVVEEVWLGKNLGGHWVTIHNKSIEHWPYAVKLVFVNNVWDKEKSEQVK